MITIQFNCVMCKVHPHCCVVRLAWSLLCWFFLAASQNVASKSMFVYLFYKMKAALKRRHSAEAISVGFFPFFSPPVLISLKLVGKKYLLEMWLNILQLLFGITAYFWDVGETWSWHHCWQGTMGQDIPWLQIYCLLEKL